MALLRYRSPGGAKAATHLAGCIFLALLFETWLVGAGRSDSDAGLSRVELRSTSMVQHKLGGQAIVVDHIEVGQRASPPAHGETVPFEHADINGLVPDEEDTPTNHEESRKELIALFKQGNYELGEANSNHCAFDSWQMPAREDCRSAAGSMKLDFETGTVADSSESDATMPKGCILKTASILDERGQAHAVVAFNPHETGQVNALAKPICMKDMSDLKAAAEHIQQIGNGINVEETLAHASLVKTTADQLADKMTEYAGDLSMTPHLGDTLLYNTDKYHGDIQRNIQLAMADAKIDQVENTLNQYYAGAGSQSRTNPLVLTEEEARDRPRTAPKEFPMPKHFDHWVKRPHYQPVEYGMLSNDEAVALAHQRFPHQMEKLISPEYGFDQHLSASALLLPGIMGDFEKALAHLMKGRTVEKRTDDAREIATLDDFTKSNPNLVSALHYLVKERGFDTKLAESALRVSAKTLGEEDVPAVKDASEKYLEHNRHGQLRKDREDGHAQRTFKTSTAAEPRTRRTVSM